MTLARATAATGAAVGAAVLAYAAATAGQTVDVQHPLTIVAGTPAGGARTDRIDSFRSGRSRDPLPAGSLASTWHVGIGAFVEHAPVVDAHGTVYAVGSRGEVVAVARDGGERWRVATGAAQAGAPVLLSDDTLVFVDALGIAVAVRDGAVRWRTRFGRNDASRPAPLALDDGGVIVATAHDLAALDADGHVRARTALPEAASVPLVAALGRVIAVTVSGAVWSWSPGAVEPTRLGSFGAPVEGGAALADDHTLLAITSAGAHLAAMDLARGTVATRATAPAGLWLGPPAVHAGTAYLQLLAPTADLAVGVDASGVETARILLGTHPPPAAADGGVLALAPVPHTPPLVDAAGTLVFATTDGSIGAARTVTGSGASRVDLVAGICPPSGDRAEPPVSGMAPLGPSSLVVACRAGALVGLQGGEGASPHL
ncbi:MAG TPA: PQQ-binding-like beta-propeller repeat protein [Polyangiaceae bacterium]